MDGYYVDKALQLTFKSICPHMDQFLNMLDTSTAEQRRNLLADDVMGPLDVLYEFASMEAISEGHTDVVRTSSFSYVIYGTDNATGSESTPVLLFGAQTALFGATASELGSSSNWRQQRVGNSLHCIVESSEPSIGLRCVRIHHYSW